MRWVPLGSYRDGHRLGKTVLDWRGCRSEGHGEARNIRPGRPVKRSRRRTCRAPSNHGQEAASSTTECLLTRKVADPRKCIHAIF
jgi:hypothetical protein